MPPPRTVMATKHDQQMHPFQSSNLPAKAKINHVRFNESSLIREKSGIAGLTTISAFTREEVMNRALLQRHPLPPITNPKLAHLRYNVWTYYRRLMLVCILANTIILILMASGHLLVGTSAVLSATATATGANLTVAVLMRHENFINLLYATIVTIPSSTPLGFRRMFAKLAYNQGGVHAGCGISAVAWYIYHVVAAYNQPGPDDNLRVAIKITSLPLVALLICIASSSYPSFRQCYHDYWELLHRYGGYLAIALVWTQTIITAIMQSLRHQALAITLLYTPNFWFLILISICIVHPWLYVRRVRVKAEPLSSHATRLWFGHRNMRVARGTRLALNPAGDCHGFATIPNCEAEKGFSVIVSHAGDFTQRLINDPPEKIWLKGAPTTGVIRVATLFEPLVIVTTGSGIGPCLSFLEVYPNYPVRIIWSARSPLHTYQKGIMSSVLRSDPEAIIIDTNKSGHPDMNALTYAVYQESEAEAIVIISNPKVTKQVVFAMESRNVPIFGAIFDS